MGRKKRTGVIPQGHGVAVATVTVAGRQVVLEEFCGYKLFQTLEMLGELGEKVDLKALIDQALKLEGRTLADQIMMGTQLVLPLLKEAPEVLMRWLALGIIPNAELAKLYDKPGAIAERVQKEMRWLQFEAKPAELVRLAIALVKCIGLEELKNELAALGLVVTLPQSEIGES